MENKKILIIDDDSAICEELFEILKEEGYKVSVAQSGKEASAVLAKLSPDVVLLDLRLPDVEGLDLVGVIRASSKDAKIIVITAHGSLETAVESIRRELFDYVNKPVDPGVLLRSITRALEMQALEREVKGRMEDLERFEKVAVGREEKITTCKQEIKKLKQEIETLKKQLASDV